ncbi:hypothetical protein [Limosilactobacillus ingluviei]|uniref:hypothetical protein n=1 Tax=Limosilactobacillus ingluviei TaxID=148604 RepID=UPI00265FF4CF|nr:hypothetical protein [Limosilactobacillus ingluviei]
MTLAAATGNNLRLMIVWHHASRPLFAVGFILADFPFQRGLSSKPNKTFSRKEESLVSRLLLIFGG